MQDMFETIQKMNVAEFLDNNRQVAILSGVFQGRTITALTLIAKLISETKQNVNICAMGVEEFPDVYRAMLEGVYRNIDTGDGNIDWDRVKLVVYGDYDAQLLPVKDGEWNVTVFEDLSIMNPRGGVKTFETRTAGFFRETGRVMLGVCLPAHGREMADATAVAYAYGADQVIVSTKNKSTLQCTFSKKTY